MREALLRDLASHVKWDALRDALRASRRRLSVNDLRCSASERRWFPARPAEHVHRRRNNGKGRIQSVLASAHGRNVKRRVETCKSAGRAGADRPSEAPHPTRSSDVLPRIARERVPTVPQVAKTRRNVATPDRAGAVDSDCLFYRSSMQGCISRSSSPLPGTLPGLNPISANLL